MTFYVYGLLPQTLTHLTAVMLTPRSQAARRSCPSNHSDNAPQMPNPDLRGPKRCCCKCC